MEKTVFEQSVIDYAESSPGNFIAPDIALRPELAGMRIFDQPIFGYAAANDAIFTAWKKPEVIGEHVLLPLDWLPEAKTVISVFFPFTAPVKDSNALSMDWPSDEWLHGRIEGQAFLREVCEQITPLLKREAPGICPLLDPRFRADNRKFMSNWSERHAAYAAGLGTFGLSKGLITRKGIAGRFISFITALYFEPSKRAYTGIYDYCIHCGLCAKHCPAGAISLEKGKAHPPCKAFLDKVNEKCKPRYGCGNCQVGLPCTDVIPLR
jgi:epoxyqueuosine reductase QueG